MVDTPRQARPEINRVVSVGWRPTNWGRWNRYKDRSPEKKKKNKVPEEKKVSKKRKCPRSQKVSKEVKQCKWTYRKEQWMNDDMCGWMFPLGVWGAGWYCNFSNIFWRSPLHCEKIVCCDVRCERRDLWKTSVTCTTICSQIDRGIPFSVYPSSAPHPGRYSDTSSHCLGMLQLWRTRHDLEEAVAIGHHLYLFFACAVFRWRIHSLHARYSCPVYVYVFYWHFSLLLRKGDDSKQFTEILRIPAYSVRFEVVVPIRSQTDSKIALVQLTFEHSTLQAVNSAV